MLKIMPKIMMTPMPIPTPPMMWSLELNTSSMAAVQLLVMSCSNPSFFGQVSEAPSKVAPVGPQQFSPNWIRRSDSLSGSSFVFLYFSKVSV
uniref:Uncharacterized protein n=1 Tax=Anguilla anguilla TaxID=7936 RepID=A0A0E9TBQ4_ANGAN